MFKKRFKMNEPAYIHRRMQELELKENKRYRIIATVESSRTASVLAEGPINKNTSKALLRVWKTFDNATTDRRIGPSKFSDYNYAPLEGKDGNLDVYIWTHWKGYDPTYGKPGEREHMLETGLKSKKELTAVTMKQIAQNPRRALQLVIDAVALNVLRKNADQPAAP